MKIWKKQLTQSQDGFTLIELLVVVVIIGILGSIAAPGWLSYLTRQRITSVQDNLRSILLETQSTAQQRASSRSVVFQTTSDGPVVTTGPSASATNPQFLGSNIKNIQITSFISGSSGVSSNTPTTSLEFDSNGGISSDSVPFVIAVGSTNSSVKKCLIVTTLLGGIAEAKDDDCNNPQPAS